jgi:hypothetical protein
MSLCPLHSCPLLTAFGLLCLLHPSPPKQMHLLCTCSLWLQRARAATRPLAAVKMTRHRPSAPALPPGPRAASVVSMASAWVLAAVLQEAPARRHSHPPARLADPGSMARHARQTLALCARVPGRHASRAWVPAARTLAAQATPARCAAMARHTAPRMAGRHTSACRRSSALPRAVSVATAMVVAPAAMGWFAAGTREARLVCAALPRSGPAPRRTLDARATKNAALAAYAAAVSAWKLCATATAATSSAARATSPVCAMPLRRHMPHLPDVSSAFPLFSLSALLCSQAWCGLCGHRNCAQMILQLWKHFLRAWFGTWLAFEHI